MPLIWSVEYAIAECHQYGHCNMLIAIDMDILNTISMVSGITECYVMVEGMISVCSCNGPISVSYMSC